MTASGNDALLITLLASLTACTGYAAGRLHQWYRTGLDRDEAYRDGYDTATRSVFTMAARLIGPRRGNRGPAVTVAEAPVILLPASSVAASPPMSSPPVRPAAFAAPSGSSAALAGPSVTGSSGTGAAASSGRGAAAPSGSGERRDSVSALAAGVLQAAGSPGSSSSQARSEASPVVPQPSRSASGGSQGAGSAARSSAVPPSKGAGPGRSASGGSASGSGGSARSMAAEQDEESSGGRHLVPDELVTAPTYRLTPDRVARAKVRQAIPDDDEGQETTRLPSVPRPRSS